MESTAFIAFRDERKAPVCYDDLALTFGRIPERSAQQAVVPEGTFSAARPYPAGHLSTRFGSLAASAPTTGWNILVPTRPPLNGGRHLCRALPRKWGGVIVAPASPRASSSCRRPAFRRSAAVCRRARGRQCRSSLSRAFRLRRHAHPCLPRGNGHPSPAPCSSASRKLARAIGLEIASSLKQR